MHNTNLDYIEITRLAQDETGEMMNWCELRLLIVNNYRAHPLLGKSLTQSMMASAKRLDKNNKYFKQIYIIIFNNQHVKKNNTKIRWNKIRSKVLNF